MKTVLVTGGCGYIGSHIVSLLLTETTHKVIIVDNLSNSSESTLTTLQSLSKPNKLTFYKADIRNERLLSHIFETETPIDVVIHLAALKSVNESVKNPLAYYDNNVSGTLTLLNVMANHNCKQLIFSSSATVYDQSNVMPVTEQGSLKPINPYGETKLMVETILNDLYKVDKSWNIRILRYFNPIGAHPHQLLGENPTDTPNNLLPYVTKTLTGDYPFVFIYGKDYDTKDGTGVRDYIHVMDLAKGHLLALNHLDNKTTCDCYNLGTGQGYSVLDVIRCMELVSDLDVPYLFTERRAGDIGTCFADVTKAYNELGFKAEYTLEDMCYHAWLWETIKRP